MVDCIICCKEVLKASPKWADFEKKLEGKTKKRKPRPGGHKKGKQEKKDQEMVKNILQITEEKSAEKSHRENKEIFMQKMGNDLDLLTRSIADRNDQQILEYCSPQSRRDFAKQIMKQRLKRIKLENAKKTLKLSSVTSSLTSDTGSDGSVHIDRVVPAVIATANESPGEKQERLEMQRQIKEEKAHDADAEVTNEFIYEA
ncbi:unknown protein [Seminavis robusta]|uniref:Uncharacterized protein n=1 Tax=Seminavis robusta TaxID=568900 RepID=A0A9N8HF49_9STRA|nr:unknown protein [Seminavis robusta]|eukprot:Sro417_g138690.1 n/a (201) ;mRNA; f:26731-27333